MNTLAHGFRSSVAVSGTALLLAVAGFGLAPAASADASQPPTLKVATAAPAEVGAAGLPVAFTTTVSNTGANDASAVHLAFSLDGAQSLAPDAVSLEYRLSGTTGWRTVPLADDMHTFSGELPDTFPLAAGRSRTVQMRFGVPMGTPHHGDSNGGVSQLTLTTLVSDGASGTPTGTDSDVIKVDGLTSAVSGLPTTVTAGGPAVTFKATVTNISASAYENVSGVLFTDRYASLQVLRSGTWQTLTPVVSDDEPGVYGFYVIGKDASLAAHSTKVAKVRLTYRKDAPAGKTTVAPCDIVNERPDRVFVGAGGCDSRATLMVLAADSTGSTSTPAPTTSATPSGSPSASAPSASATPPASPSVSPSVSSEAPSATSDITPGPSGTGSQLAETGSSGTSTLVAAGGAFLLAGAAGLGAVALRRRRAGA